MVTTKKITSNRADDAILEMATGLYDIGVIDAMTLRDFDNTCIEPVKDLSPKKIKLIRFKEKVSQGVFAKYLNVGVETVRCWEQGKRHPQGTALKLLQIVDKKGLASLAL